MNKSQDSKQIVSEKEKQKIMREIEAKTEKIVITGIKTGQLVNPINAITQGMSKEQAERSSDLLIGIMGSGAKEFEEKVGRPMTYSEMRAMYG